MQPLSLLKAIGGRMGPGPGGVLRPVGDACLVLEGGTQLHLRVTWRRTISLLPYAHLQFTVDEAPAWLPLLQSIGHGPERIARPWRGQCRR